MFIRALNAFMEFHWCQTALLSSLVYNLQGVWCHPFRKKSPKDFMPDDIASNFANSKEKIRLTPQNLLTAFD